MLFVGRYFSVLWGIGAQTPDYPLTLMPVWIEPSRQAFQVAHTPIPFVDEYAFECHLQRHLLVGFDHSESRSYYKQKLDLKPEMTKVVSLLVIGMCNPPCKAKSQML